jgi:hypothetical protein
MQNTMHNSRTGSVSTVYRASTIVVCGGFNTILFGVVRDTC